jgi:RNA polymerase sigma factor (sigma-70 family)
LVVVRMASCRGPLRGTTCKGHRKRSGMDFRRAVELAQRADAELIRALYADHGQALFSYAMRLLDGDRHQAEDIVQETLLRAWRHPEALQVGRGDVRPWLWTVARRLVVDRFRARRVRPSEVSEHLVGDAFAESVADDDVDRVLLAWQVADALRSFDHRPSRRPRAHVLPGRLGGGDR